MTKDGIRLRCGRSITLDQEGMIDKLLADLSEKAHSRMVLVIDTGGQVISFNGDRKSIDLIGLGALVAADFSASQEIARLANVYQDNQLIIRQGSKFNTIIHEIGREMILMVMVPSSTPLGWFSYLVRQTSRQIEAAIIQNGNKLESFAVLPTSTSLEEEFSAALDNIWKS